MYECPRCSLLGADNASNKLDFVYRFWLKLRDANGDLKPCLLEGSTALKLVNNIEPEKYYTDSKTAHQVMKLLGDKWDKKFLFTLDVFNVNEANTNATHLDQDEKRNLKVIYKIVHMQELL